MEIIIKPAKMFNTNPDQGLLGNLKNLFNQEFQTDFSINLDTINNELIFTEE